MRKGFVVGAAMLGLGVALTLLAFVVVAIFGETTPTGSQQVTGGLGAVAGLSLLGGAALMILAVPVGLIVLFVSAFSRGTTTPAPPALASPFLPAPEPLAPPDFPPVSDTDPPPPPDPRDQVVPVPWASDIGFSVQVPVPPPRRPLAWRIVVGSFVALLFAVLGWSVIVQPMVGKYLFLDGVPAQATVVSVDRMVDTCVLTVEYEVAGETVTSPAAWSDSASCQARVGATEDIVYSPIDPTIWRYAGLVTFPFVVVGVFAVAVALIWMSAVFGRRRPRAVLRMHRFRS